MSLRTISRKMISMMIPSVRASPKKSFNSPKRKSHTTSTRKTKKWLPQPSKRERVWVLKLRLMKTMITRLQTIRRSSNSTSNSKSEKRSRTPSTATLKNWTNKKC